MSLVPDAYSEILLVCPADTFFDSFCTQSARSAVTIATQVSVQEGLLPPLHPASCTAGRIPSPSSPPPEPPLAGQLFVHFHYKEHLRRLIPSCKSPNLYSVSFTIRRDLSSPAFQNEYQMALNESVKCCNLLRAFRGKQLYHELHGELRHELRSGLRNWLRHSFHHPWIAP